jgi:phage shock protein PspC (stress-responsive transcriptional regulator)
MFYVHRIEITDKEEMKMTTHRKQALRRSRKNRILAGVCGGLAEFFGISAFWFRLAMLIAFIPGGVPGLLIYLLAWIIIPSE